MFRKRDDQDEDGWIGVSDIMSGLMMIFMFVAISFMSNLQAKADQVREIAVAYQEVQDGLYEDLEREFRDDLPRWQAEIDRETLAVRFREPEVLFGLGQAVVRPRFAEVLRDFFPRYLKIIRSERYRGEIEEIRIEGHTSSDWATGASETEAYFWNMALSQDRTRAVLEFCLGTLTDADDRAWVRRFITANGLSSSRLIVDTAGNEDPQRSRRVEFRTKTAAERRVVQIIQQVSQEER